MDVPKRYILMKKILTKQWFWYLVVMPLAVGAITIATIIKLQQIVDKAYADGNTQTESSKQDTWEEAYFQGQNDGYQAYEEGQREQLLKTLAWHESYGGKVRKILDTNGKFSYGLYHFQVDTVIDLYRRYYGQRITPDRALEIANNDDLATKLAYDAIFVHNEKRHWTNSFKKMALK